MLPEPLTLTLHEELDFDWESHDAAGAARVCRVLLETELLATGDAVPGGNFELRGRAGVLAGECEKRLAAALERELVSSGLGAWYGTWNPDARKAVGLSVAFEAPLRSRHAQQAARDGDLLAVSGEPGERAALRSLAVSSGGWDRLLLHPPVGARRAIERERNLEPPRGIAALVRRDRLRGVASLARGLPSAVALLSGAFGAEIWIEDLPMGATAHRAAERERCEVSVFALLECAEPELLMALEPSEYFHMERMAQAEGLRLTVMGRVVSRGAGLSRVTEGGVPVPLPASKRLPESRSSRESA